MLQRLTDHPRYATRHSLTPETIGIGHPGVPLIYLIYLRSSTPINTWIRSRGSDASHSSRDQLQEGAYATQRTPTSKIVIHRGNCAKLRLERIELRARARVGFRELERYQSPSEGGPIRSICNCNRGSI